MRNVFLPSHVRASNKASNSLRAKADAARDARNWPVAAALYEAYLEDASRRRDAPIWVQLGHARKESGNHPGAMQAYQRAIELAPDIADTHLQIGHLHKRMGALGQAGLSYAEALRIDPNLDDARRELAALSAGPRVMADDASTVEPVFLAEAQAARHDSGANGAGWDPPPKAAMRQAVQFAHPLPLSPEQVTFDPAFPPIYVGLSRRFDTTWINPSEPT